MLGRAFGLTKKRKKETGDKEKPAENASIAPIGNIAKMMNPSGRIGLQMLQKMVKVYEKPDFIRFMRQPVLVGSSIQAGSFADQKRAGSNEMNRTIIFEVDVEEDVSSASETLKHAIYPLVKSEYATGAKTIFSVGRVRGNDMVMPDLAISKQHAIIEIKKGQYFIQDCGSTNGTTLNGQRFSKRMLQIHDGDIIGFARYEFTFHFPGTLYDILKG